MSLTAEETVALLEKLGTATKTLAEAEKTRADADKLRADTESVRATIESDRRLAQNKLDAAAEDLESKRITNQAARDLANDTHADKLISQLTGAIPDLSALLKGSVTFGTGKALRQGETVAVALEKVADEISSQVEMAALDAKAERPGAEVFVVTDPGLVAALAAYRQISAEAEVLNDKVTEAIREATTVLDARPAAHLRKLVAGQAAVVGAAVAGKVITELASLFEVEVEVLGSETEIPASTVQAAVIGKLLANVPGLKVRHEWARVPLADSSPLLKSVENLTASDAEATQVGARLDAAIKELGAPAAKLAEARKAVKDLNDAGRDEPATRTAEDAVNDAEGAVARLALLEKVSTNLVAILSKARAFAERVVTAVEGKPSSLGQALSVEPLAIEVVKSQKAPETGKETEVVVEFLVLVLGGAKVGTDQLLIKRRLRAPRVQVSTSVEVDFFLVDGPYVLLAGHETAATRYSALIKGDGLGADSWKWKQIEPLAALSRAERADREDAEQGTGSNGAQTPPSTPVLPQPPEDPRPQAADTAADDLSDTAAEEVSDGETAESGADGQPDTDRTDQPPS